MSKKRVATRFLKTFGAVLEDKAAADPALTKFVEALKEGRSGAIGKSPGDRPEAYALGYLDEMLAGVPGDAEFSDALKATSDAGVWYAPYDATELGEQVARGMVALQVAGGLGLLRTDRLFAGLFLIAPHVTYPLHDHISEELYFVVSGAVDIQNGFNGKPRHVTPGNYSVTPSGMPHRLMTGDDPVLIAYVWTGQVRCDVFWWEHVGGDAWRRFVPKRASR